MLYYSDRVKYSRQIQRYYNTIDKEQIKIIVYDAFEHDNAKVYRDVLVFLGIGPEITPAFTITNYGDTTRRANQGDSKTKAAAFTVSNRSTRRNDAACRRSTSCLSSPG